MAPQREWFEKDYYSVLGVPQSATEKEIARAYRKLAKEFHPDANAGNKDAEERFKEISAANDVLGDAEKRKEYDQVREMVASGAGPGGFGPGGFGPGAGGFPGGQGFGNIRFEDLGDCRRPRRPPRQPLRWWSRRRAGAVVARSARSTVTTSRPSSTSTSSTRSTVSPRR